MLSQKSSEQHREEEKQEASQPVQVAGNFQGREAEASRAKGKRGGNELVIAKAHTQKQADCGNICLCTFTRVLNDMPAMLPYFHECKAKAACNHVPCKLPCYKM